MKKYELFSHTADIGLFIYGKNLNELFQHAGEAFTDLISEAKTIQPTEKRTIQIKGENDEELLIHFLKELLYLFEVEKILFSRFDFSLWNKKSVQCEMSGEFFDEKKHPFKTELKAVTYHQLKIEKWKDGLKATVVLDV